MASPLVHLHNLSLLLSCTCILLFLPSLSAAISQASHTISLGSSLTAPGNSSWVSPSGQFAFGFHPLLNLLAVWYDEIPEKTIVWSVSPVNGQRGSKVELTSGGQLVLYDHGGANIWQRQGTNTSRPVAAAAMLDTGNFVLFAGDNSSQTGWAWATFDEPTDTILPTQKLELNGTLWSRLSESNYAPGKFKLRLGNFKLPQEPKGSLLLFTVNVPTGFPYYFDGASIGSLGNGSQLFFNESDSSVYLVQINNGTKLTLTSAGLNSTYNNFYQRAVLDFDGVFRHYIRPKTGRADWSVTGFVPSDICMTVEGYPGSGVCGFNSLCKLDQNQRPRCECPPGYSYLNPNNTFGGCKQDFASQSCGGGGDSDAPKKTRTVFDMQEKPNTTWTFGNFEHYSPFEEQECKKICLDDCFCAVALFFNGSCYKKKHPLANGRTHPNISVKALIKIPIGNSSLQDDFPPDSCGGKKDHGRLVLIGSTVLGGSVFLNFTFLLAIVAALFYSYPKKVLGISQENSSFLELNLRCFAFKELEKATDGFAEELGRGAFGSVYKGMIVASNSTKVVAVKRLDKVVQEGEREFKTEMSVIGETHHRNLVQLLGFCDEGPHRLLVYEFMSNGSLARFLSGNSSKPGWRQRCQIATGIARGLMYLHEECSTQIIHCDIKPENILLDEGLDARISDFGLAKLLKTDQARTSTGIRGTRGYLAPEWFKNLSITVKVDVYSFGIVLLEIICCRRHIDMGTGHESEVILKDWAYRCYREGRLDALVKDDEAMEDWKTVERMVMVAIWCVQEDPSLRPSMKRVVRMLTGVVHVSVPTDPTFSSFL